MTDRQAEFWGKIERLSCHQPKGPNQRNWDGAPRTTSLGCGDLPMLGNQEVPHGCPDVSNYGSLHGIRE